MEETIREEVVQIRQEAEQLGLERARSKWDERVSKLEQDLPSRYEEPEQN
ncbi:hypothetical protein [Aeromonas simiae]|nr:hypothetical protein [Aeromonas simiae]MDO2947780.1 hypothetical protein [Aeromonas simiae]MDO2952619.1 hypothetical protein [Aeromonas simiae]MDO2954995.1 hypothetical protein [Aeromonas simiae]